MYIVTLILEDNGNGPTFWYANMSDVIFMVEEFVGQGYLVQIEKVN